MLTTVAGDGNFGYAGDGELATRAVLDAPSGVAVDVDGHRIRKVVFVDMPNRSPDFDGDGWVRFADFLLLAAAFESSNATYDLDEDGTVGLRDAEILVAAFGQAVEAP